MNYAQFRQRYVWNPNAPDQLLGEGSFGKVYLARDKHLGRSVALKISPVSGQREESSLRNEAALVRAKLTQTHPNIVQYESCDRLMTDMGEYDFAILRYYEAGNLQQLMSKTPLSDAQKANIARQILEGIAFYQSCGIIHRDLKPANILISKEPDGEYVPKIGDFGISKAVETDGKTQFTNTIQGAGTFRYAAPEQLSETQLRFNTDLWSFGVLLYGLYFGTSPFPLPQTQSLSVDQTRRAYLTQLRTWVLEARLVESVPEPFQEWLKRCLVVDPKKRAQSAAELLALLPTEVDMEIILEPSLLNTPLTQENPNPQLPETEVTQFEAAHPHPIHVENATMPPLVHNPTQRKLKNVAKLAIILVVIFFVVPKFYTFYKIEREINAAQQEKSFFLELSDFKLKRIPESIKDLKQLTSLNLHVNQISDLSVLRDLKQLTKLRLEGNEISDISPLRDLKQLTSLNLYLNQISDISALKDLKQLTSLNLRYNSINDVSALRELKQLTSLNLVKNEISDVSVLKDLKQLTYLNLAANQISDVSALKDLKQLTCLDLRLNNIKSFNLDLNEFPNLKELYLNDNPLQNIPKEIIGDWDHNCITELREYQKKHSK